MSRLTYIINKCVQQPHHIIFQNNYYYTKDCGIALCMLSFCYAEILVKQHFPRKTIFSELLLHRHDLFCTQFFIMIDLW